MPKLEAYDKKLSYSYCLGLFPCHQLLDARPECAQRLLLHPAGLGNEGVEKLRKRAAELGIREEEAERVLRRESKKDNCFASIVFEKYQCRLNPDESHAVFCQISDGGNLGTAARAALGFGYKNLAVIRPCVDAFDPHVLRASMGAFFRLNAHVYNSFDEYLQDFPNREIYPFMLDGAIDLNKAAARAGKTHTLVFGNEASGLPAHFQSYGQSVKIPQSDEIDSLNLAVAASIAMYTFKNIER
ncbi:MAG: TrmH family RNA methyltransferase [Clostridia bacterium]|nr:TrmH family RNA methyltransferase [Clostridia bacterium]